jgi:glycine oxidase
MSEGLASANARAEVLIVGGGVIGLSVARALARRGMRDVTLLEKNDFGREASWAAGGILAPQVEADSTDDFFRLACASRDLYPRFASELEAESDVDVELNTTGTLYVALSEQDERELRERFAWQQREGLAVEWLGGDQARQLEPCLSKHVRCALRFPHDYQVNNRKLTDALVISNKKLGVRLENDCHTTGLLIDAGRIIGVETSNGPINAAVVVVAAGAWSSSIRQVAISIAPVRGQMLCFHPPEPFAHHVIYSARGYLIPRRDGRILAGSTTEHVGFDKSVTDRGVETIRSLAFEIAPAVEDLPLSDSWAGFRPHAVDDLPVLGSTKEVDGLFFATGHYRNGILLAPITGELIAEAILTGDNPSPLAPFSPDRPLQGPVLTR